MEVVKTILVFHVPYPSEAGVKIVLRKSLLPLSSHAWKSTVRYSNAVV